jgi:peptidoglycan/LPS O-acetylase OafA/YrhL
MAAAAPADSPDRLAALDAVRVLATVGIFTFHLHALAGTVFFSAEDWGQFLNAHPWYYRALFFTADVGVQAFIYLSMFSLALSALRKPAFQFGSWLRARAQRIYPGLWLSMLVVASFLWLIDRPGDLTPTDYVANALGITILRPFRQMAGAWWFVGMILTAYPLFPLLLWCARRRLHWVMVGVGWLVSKGSETWLWPRIGSWFHTFEVSFVGIRLMEIAMGVALGAALHRAGPAALARAGWRTFLVLGTALLVVFYLYGMNPQFAPIGPLRGCLFLCLLALLCVRLPHGVLRVCGRLAGPTYLVYLLHQPISGQVAVWIQRAGVHGLTGFLVTWAVLLVALFLLAIPLDALATRLGRVVFRGR